MKEVDLSDSLLANLSSNLNLNEKELKQSLQKLLEDLIQPSIPTSIFTNKLTPLESIVKYLKEEKQLNFHQISLLIKRNEKNIWQTYHTAKKKFPKRFKTTTSEIQIPLNIFSSTIPPMKTIVKYLHEKRLLSYHNIGLLLNKNERTIWTAYHRK
jgi:hypothetical protein